MDEQQKLGLIQSKALEFSSIDNFLHGLQLGEMIATADGAQSSIQSAGFQSFPIQTFAHVTVPGDLQIEADVFPAIQLDLATKQIGLPKPHAAADVIADQMRIDYTLGDERRADGGSLAGMQIRKSDYL